MGKKVGKNTKFEKWVELSDKLALSISVFKNEDDVAVLNLRKFYLNREDEWRPDKQGLTMRIEDDKCKDLRKAIRAMEEVADDAPEPDFAKKGKSKDDDKKSKGKKSKKSKDDDDDEDDDE